MSENFVAPGQQRYLRACMVCSIVMTSAVSDLISGITPVYPELLTNILFQRHSASAKKDVRTAKSSSTSKDPPTK
jgi:hypothetical protein